MMSWSLLTVHKITVITLQFMRGFYDGQESALISNATPKI